MDESAESLTEAIRSAFASVDRGQITLHEGQVLDDYGTDDERARARQRDSEVGWESIPDAWIEECPNALSYLDPESWRYYIAAHMVWVIRHCETDRSVLTDFTIYSLLGGIDGRFELLTRDQSRVVCRFIRYMLSQNCDVDAAQQALGGHWSEFDDDRTLPT